jgi:hypothetical protein
MEKRQYTLFLAVVGFILIVSLFKWSSYLLENNYIVECFEQQNESNVNKSNVNVSNSTTSHTVDLPLTTTSSCRNFCAPATARCALTGHQCFTDIDCPGCQPQSSNSIVGDDDAGKLTVGVTPQYSNLTSDKGTKAFTILDKEFSKTPSPAFGVNTWRDDFEAEQKLFDKRYKPPSTLPNMPAYPPRYTVTGDFLENGPLASNATM